MTASDQEPLDVAALDAAFLEAEHEETKARERQSARRRAEIGEWRRLLKAHDAQAAYRDTIREAILGMDSVPVLERVGRPTNSTKPRHTWVLVVSDVHVGQKTPSEHTGGLFTQSMEQTREQMQTLWQKIERLHAIASKSIHVERLVVLALGDLVEGDGMRASQATKIDALVTKQTIEAASLLSGLYTNALSIFPQVSVRNVGGNHDRTTGKPGDAGLGELGYQDTYAWLIGEFQKTYFEKAIAQGRLDYVNHDSFFGGSIIAGHRFVYEHGCSFKTSSGSYGGIGWYPIQAAATKYSSMLDGADFVVFGHFHRAACLPHGRGWQVLNGSFPPSTHWVQATFKQVTVPNQVLLDIHAEHGLVRFQPLYLPHEGLAKPGEFWERAAQ